MDSVNVNMEPPPYEEACSMPPMNAENRSALPSAPAQPLQTQPQPPPGAPHQGYLAKRTSISWDFCSNHLRRCCRKKRPFIGAVDRPNGDAVRMNIAINLNMPAPPEAIIDAYQFKCGICERQSYVKHDRVGTYISCPFCKKTSTTNPAKSIRSAIIHLTLGIVVPLLMMPIVYFLVTSGNQQNRRLFGTIFLPIVSTWVLLNRAALFYFAPTGTLSEHVVRYWPKAREVVEYY